MNGTTIAPMPRQNTPPAQFPAQVLEQISALAQRIVAARKSQGHTQAQWAQRLGISQPTMARIERGDPAVATATYVMCLWLINPHLQLTSLLDTPAPVLATSSEPLAPQPVSPHAAPHAASPADEFAALLAQWKVPAL